MAGSRSMAPLNRSNSVVIVVLLSAFKIYGFYGACWRAYAAVTPIKTTRCEMVKMALSLSTAPWLMQFKALPAPFIKMVKITDIKTLGLDNTGDGCILKI